MHISKKEFELSFKERLLEIKRYIDFLSKIEKGISYTNEKNIVSNYKNHTEIRIILRANTHLLIYNLIEFTVANICIRIASEINQGAIPLRSLPETIQRHWLQLNINQFNDRKIETETLISNLLNLASFIDEKEKASFDIDRVKRFNAMGNVKEKKISELSRIYKFPYNKRNKIIQNGTIIDSICDNRQRLSHGESTFSEVGKSITTEQIKKEFGKVEKYLKLIITSVEEYLQAKQYLNRDFSRSKKTSATIVK